MFFNIHKNLHHLSSSLISTLCVCVGNSEWEDILPAVVTGLVFVKEDTEFPRVALDHVLQIFVVLSSKGLVKPQISITHSQGLLSSRFRLGPENLHFEKFQGGADTAPPWSILWEPWPKIRSGVLHENKAEETQVSNLFLSACSLVDAL